MSTDWWIGFFIGIVVALFVEVTSIALFIYFRTRLIPIDGQTNHDDAPPHWHPDGDR